MGSPINKTYEVDNLNGRAAIVIASHPHHACELVKAADKEFRCARIRRLDTLPAHIVIIDHY